MKIPFVGKLFESRRREINPPGFIPQLEIALVDPYDPSKYSEDARVINPGSDTPAQGVSQFSGPFSLRTLIEKTGDVTIVLRALSVDRRLFLNRRDEIITAASDHAGLPGLREVMSLITDAAVPEKFQPVNRAPSFQREALVWTNDKLERGSFGQPVAHQRRLTNREIGPAILASYTGKVLPSRNHIPSNGSFLSIASPKGITPMGEQVLKLQDGRFCAYWSFVPYQEEEWNTIVDLLKAGYDLLVRLVFIKGQLKVGFYLRAFCSASYQVSMNFFRKVNADLGRGSVRSEWIRGWDMRKAFHMFVLGSSTKVSDTRLWKVDAEMEESFYQILTQQIEQAREPGNLFLGVKDGKPVLIRTGHSYVPPVICLSGDTGSGKSSLAGSIRTQLSGVAWVELSFSSHASATDIQVTKKAGKQYKIHFPSPGQKGWKEPPALPPNVSVEDHLTTYFPAELVAQMGVQDKKIALAFMAFYLPGIRRLIEGMKKSWGDPNAKFGTMTLPLAFRPALPHTDMTLYTLFIYEILVAIIEELWPLYRQQHRAELGNIYLTVSLDDVASMAGTSKSTFAGALAAYAGGRISEKVGKWSTHVTKSSIALLVTDHPGVPNIAAAYPVRIEFPGSAAAHQQATLFSRDGGTYKPEFTFNPYMAEYKLRQWFCREP